MRTTLLLLMAALVGVGCDKKPPATAPAPAKPSAGAFAATGSSTTAVKPPAAGAGSEISALGVKFALPTGWRSAPPANQMRLAEARVPDPTGDDSKSCLVVFSTAGGDIQGNITRWAGQVRDAAGQPATPKVSEREVAGMKVTVVELTGAFSGMNEKTQEGWMLRGAIVETPGGLLFIKMTGPAAAMTGAGPAFEQMLTGLKKG